MNTRYDSREASRSAVTSASAAPLCYRETLSNHERTSPEDQAPHDHELFGLRQSNASAKRCRAIACHRTPKRSATFNAFHTFDVPHPATVKRAEARNYSPTMKLLLFALCSLLFILPAHSAVVYSGVINESIPMDTNGVYLNPLVGTTNVDPFPSTWGTQPWLNPFMGGVYVASNDLLFPAITGVDQIVNLTPGTLIDSTLTYPTTFNGSADHTAAVVTPNKFTLGTPGIIGLKFKPTASSTDTFYGWASVTFSNTGAGSINSYAYQDTPGTGVAAGFTGSAVPEPSRALLLMLGAISLAMRRRRGDGSVGEVVAHR